MRTKRTTVSGVYWDILVKNHHNGTNTIPKKPFNSNWNDSHTPVVDNSWNKYSKTIRVMFDVISNGEDYPDRQYQINVVNVWTSCPDSSKFNDYTDTQLAWLHKLMTVCVILNELVVSDSSLNRDIVKINSILDTLYAKQEDVSKIKLNDAQRENALMLLDQYKTHPKMLRLSTIK